MKRWRRATCLAAAVLIGAVSPGCYRKVVDAKGIGADELAPRRAKPTTTIIEDLENAVRGDLA